MSQYLFPRIGVGVMIQNEAGELLLGLRQGSHGAGEWSFPGGRLELGETLLEAAARETLAETGLVVDDFELVALADELRYLKSDGKQFVMIGFKAKKFSGEPSVVEPDKWLKWQWFALDNLPQPLFQGTEIMIKYSQSGKIF